MEPFAVECIDLNMKLWRNKDAKVIYNETTDACCVLIVIDNKLFVVFKYTDSNVDWEYNYKFYPKLVKPVFSGSKIRIHYGHLLQYKSIEKEYKDCMRDLLDDSITDIIFTGFSLGGSLCQIAAWDTNKNPPKPNIHCYCFGAPNVGNKYFAREFNKLNHVQRIIYGKDPVPVLPPRLFGYSRTKNPLLIIKISEVEYKFVKKDRSLCENIKILSSIVNSKLRDKKVGNWQDHSLKRIKRAVQLQ